MVTVSKELPFLQLKSEPWAAPSLSFIAFGPIPPATQHTKGWLRTCSAHSPNKPQALTPDVQQAPATRHRLQCPREADALLGPVLNLHSSGQLENEKCHP